MLGLEGGEGVPVGDLAEEMDGEDGFNIACRAGGKDFRYRLRVQVEGEGVDVCEDGSGSGAEDGTGAGEEAEGCGDDGVLGRGRFKIANAGGGHGEPESVCAAGAADGVWGGTGGGCGMLELSDFRAEDEALRDADALDGLHDFITDEGELAGEVEEGNGLDGGLRGGGVEDFGHVIMLQVRGSIGVNAAIAARRSVRG